MADCGARQSRSEPLLLLALFSTALAPWVIPTIIANANHEVAKSEAGAKRAVTLMDEIKSVETARRDWTSGVTSQIFERHRLIGSANSWLASASIGSRSSRWPPAYTKSVFAWLVVRDQTTSSP